MTSKLNGDILPKYLSRWFVKKVKLSLGRLCLLRLKEVFVPNYYFSLYSFSVSAGEHRDAHAILPRLLAIEYMSPTEQPFYKFHMDNKSVVVYPSLTSKKVKATGYLGALRRVILSLSDPYRLSYFTLGDSTVETMKSNVVCSAMSVDVTRNLLVLAIGLPWSAMYTMKPDGEGYKLLFNISQPSGDRYDFPTALAMDLERDFVYMCLRNKILSADLNGKIRNVLFQGSSLQSIDFDPIGDVVYIGRRRDVLRISLMTNNILNIASFKTSVFSLLYYDNQIYASLYYLDSLVTASVQNKKQEFHILTTKRNPQPMILCRIV